MSMPTEDDLYKEIINPNFLCFIVVIGEPI